MELRDRQAMNAPSVLALDLEGTLISNAISQIPRPGLFQFLARAHELFPRIVMFTTVREARFREIAKRLVLEGFAPDWFAFIEYVNWKGKTKDLCFVPGAKTTDILLVDDQEIYIEPSQVNQWIFVACFESPYLQDDTGLKDILPYLDSIRLSN